MAEVSSSKYKYWPVVSLDGASIVHWHCLERLSDHQFAVVYTEFHDALTEPEKKLAETLTPFMDLGITSSDEVHWTFFPTVQEAIAASKEVMGSYASWMKNAQYQ